MSSYSVIIQSFVYLLVPVSIILTGFEESSSNVLLNLFFYILITPVFAQSIMKSMYLNQAVGQAGEAVERTERLINAEPLPVADNPVTVSGYDISFKNVSFCYPGTDQKAVDNISFTLPEGRTYALVGASGSGKTTIARLLPRFWDADSGQISIGGTDVRDIDPSELMKNISFVFQNTKLFKTSLRDNVRYGNPDASETDIENALASAQCMEILEKLPAGLDTKIGTEGIYLSGGEQQRFSLARSILKNSPIVVLDEATAFADPENEHLIQKALGKLRAGKTVLMIAHRLTSVQDVDCILVISNGKIGRAGDT